MKKEPGCLSFHLRPLIPSANGKNLQSSSTPIFIYLFIFRMPQIFACSYLLGSIPLLLACRTSNYHDIILDKKDYSSKKVFLNIHTWFVVTHARLWSPDSANGVRASYCVWNIRLSTLRKREKIFYHIISLAFNINCTHVYNFFIFDSDTIKLGL